MKSKEPHFDLVQCSKAGVYGTCDLPTDEKKLNIGDRCVLCKSEIPNRLLGTGLSSKRWVMSEQVKLHVYLQPLTITCIAA